MGAIAPAPSSSAPRPPRRSPPRPEPASFRTLPPELKTLIAEHVHSLDLVERRTRRSRRDARAAAKVGRNVLPDRVEELLRRRGKRSTKELAGMMNQVFSWVSPCRTSLAAFSLVNRECFLVARPLLWQHVDLQSRSCAGLYDFIRNILPRHANLITSLRVDVESIIHHDDLEDDDEGWLDPEQKRLIRAAERFGQVKPTRKLHTRRLRMPSLFVAEVFKRCTNLEKLDYTMSDPQTLPTSEPDYAHRALLASRPRLVSLACHVSDGEKMLDGTVEMLDTFPDLERLKIRGFVSPDSTGDPEYRRLWQAMGRLSRLARLEAHLPLPTAISSITITWPLRHLTLTAEDSVRPDLAAFFQHVSSTLESLRYHFIALDLRTYVESGSTVLAGQPYTLPRLTTLYYEDEIYTPSHPSILSLFSSAPLCSFTLVDAMPHDTDDALSLIQACRTTLRDVYLLDNCQPPLNPRPVKRDIMDACKAHGIRCEMETVPPSESDTEGDDSDLIPSDELTDYSDGTVSYDEEGSDEDERDEWEDERDED
ncbi:hypothetical protein JCM8097_005483 [Rhodosporidiobolus ruineniae]